MSRWLNWGWGGQLWTHATPLVRLNFALGEGLLLPALIEQGKLLNGNHTQQMPRGGIGWIHQAQPHPLVLTGVETKIAEGKTFT